MKKIILLLLTLFTLAGCNSFVIQEKIIDNYCLIATDGEEACNLSYQETEEESYGTVINATVFGVGYNDNYMIVKQHPRTFPNPSDKKVTNYYILPLKKGMDWRTKNGLIGPLTLEQFNNKRKELNIPNEVTFTKVIKDLQ